MTPAAPLPATTSPAAAAVQPVATSPADPDGLADLALLGVQLRQRGCAATLVRPRPYLAVHPAAAGARLRAVYTSGVHFYLAPAQTAGPRTDIAFTADTLAWALRACPTIPAADPS